MNSSNLFGPSASGNAVGIQNNGLLDELEQVLEQIEQFLEAMDKNAQQVNATTLQDQPNPDSGNDGPSGVQGSSPTSVFPASAPATSPSGDTGAPDQASDSDAQAITDNLRSKFGLNNQQIAGVLGNLQQESGLSPDINQGGTKGNPSSNMADDNANGWGLAQWGGSRKQGELDYAQQHSLSPGSLQANLGFMDQELEGPYSKTISDIKGTSNIQDAAKIWDQDYEQASDPEMSSRDQYAANFLQQGL
ncbi:phage tail tip lysozyme [Gluconobacter kondonii]|uniref:phage tail tip lysozyme n=1 Tax=Gluconobacter kondonii TaxID=941463 RepID=UPI001B8B6C0E|nr:phage tail tip lysozyme [Gluconobacter kondonii]MBS1058220.1 hypothetical protein [Gluconobacter kondonii]